MPGLKLKAADWERIVTVGDLRKRCEGKGGVAVMGGGGGGGGADGHVRWAIDVGSWNPSDEEWQEALLLVDPARREKVARYRFVADQRRHLIGRISLAKVVHEQCGIAYKDLEFGNTKGNKPILSTPIPATCPFKNFNFNYSHEGDMVVVGAEPCSIVGVDVGFVEIRGNSSVEEHFNTFKNNFSASEWLQINGYSFYVYLCCSSSASLTHLSKGVP